MRLLDRSASVLLLTPVLLTSPPRAVQAAPAPSALSAALSAPAVQTGRPVTVSGVVRPAGSVVMLWQHRAGAWRGVARQTSSATGTYRFPVVPNVPGWWSHRVTAGALVAQPPELDVYRLFTYRLATRGQVGAEGARFGTVVASTYADPRGWPRSHRRFARVATGGDVTVVLAQASLVPSCSPGCSALYSCRVGRDVILNVDRWRLGARAFPGSLAQYRQMVVNHETGHWLGLAHASCPRRGSPAPVMQRQSKGMQGCLPNAWPLADELAAVRR